MEDNKINQELALALLTSNGITTEVANDGQEALDLLAKQLLSMPMRLLARRKFPHYPVLM